MRVPMFVLTGGDPLKRPDLQAIVRYARHQSLKTSLTPSATPQLTREEVFELKKSGLMRMALSLNGSTPQLHDRFRGCPRLLKANLGRMRSIYLSRSLFGCARISFIIAAAVGY
jgi:MoaA/NifB/PqqE/SkfB family radical SAM enzyme